MFVLIAILCLMLLIMLHECGHFIVAKIFNAHVTDFSIGMGPTLFHKQIGETDYKLSLFPIGGYVSIVGEDGNTDDPRSLLNLDWWKRLLVMLAGVTMNFIIGIVLICTLVFPYNFVVTPVLDEVPPEISKAYQLEQGDEILSIDSFHIFNINDIIYAEVLNRDSELEFTIQKESGEKEVYICLVDNEVSLSNLDFVIEEGNFLNKSGMVLNSAASMIQSVIESLKLLFTGNVQLSEMSGPIGIIDTAAKAESTYNFVYIFAFISINLACMNLLPIPALDGGQSLICIFEGITKKRINQKVIGVINGFTFFVLMGLIVIVSISDVLKLF